MYTLYAKVTETQQHNWGSTLQCALDSLKMKLHKTVLKVARTIALSISRAVGKNLTCEDISDVAMVMAGLRQLEQPQLSYVQPRCPQGSPSCTVYPFCIMNFLI